MKLRIVSGQTLRMLELDDVSQVVVYTDQGDPCSASIETPDRTVITAHAGDQDFRSHLKRLGVQLRSELEVVDIR